MIYVVKSYDCFAGTDVDAWVRDLDGVYVFDNERDAKAKAKEIKNRFAHSADTHAVPDARLDDAGDISMSKETFERLFS